MALNFRLLLLKTHPLNSASDSYKHLARCGVFL